MSAVYDLRSALAVLKQAKGQLIETDVAADPNAEISGIYRYVGAAGTTMRPTKIDGPAMVFNNVKGYPGAKVAIGLMASRKRVALLFGCKSEDLGRHMAAALANPIPNVMVDKAPCQEVV